MFDALVSRRRFTCGLSLALLLALAAPAALAESSVRDAALQTYVHGLTEASARELITPKTLPELRALLAEEDFPRRDNVVAFLSLLGGADDGDALASLLQSPFAVLTPEEDRALLLAPEGLGRIAARGDASAREALLRMTDPDLALWDWSGLKAAVAEPDSYREDLLASAAWGLAAVGDAEALARLALMDARADELAPLAPESLRRAIAQALERREPAQPQPSGAPTPPVFEDSGLGDGEQTDALDDQSRTHETAWTYANHPETPNPMDNARLDGVTDTLDLKLGRDDYAGDTACCVTFRREGDARVFGSAGDGLDSIDTAGELNTAIGDNVSRFKVVRLIRYCGGPTTNTVGCAATPGHGIVVVRLSNIDTESVVWGHEYGHNTGLLHVADGRQIMFGGAGPDRNGVTQSECDSFHSPPASTQASIDDVGACLDSDNDSVHDVLDNCPNDPNTNQTDADGDGHGAACDCNDNDPQTYPGAPEQCKDGIDQDCDGKDRKGGCPKERCRNGVDDDGDGLIDCADSDCSRRKHCR